jgi:hypothetical protein
MKKINLKNSTISFRKDGIMHLHIQGCSTMELEDAEEVIAAIGIIGHKKKYPLLIDCEGFSSVGKEARIFSASKGSNIYSLAVAIAYHSLAHKLHANFYVNHDKPEIETKVFQSTDSAITWLKTFL